MQKPYFVLALIILGSWMNIQAQNSENVKILAHWDGEDVPFNGSAKYNDVWGFVVNDMEYGCIGSTLGTHIFSLPEDHQIQEVAFIPGAFQGPVVHRDFAFHQNHLYAVCDQGTSSLQVIDVRSLPFEANLVLDDTTHIKTAHNVTVDDYGEKLYVSGPSGSPMKVFDISSTPENPEFIYDLLDYMEIEYVHDVFARRDSVFLNCGTQGLFVFDFSNGTLPEIMGSLTDYPGQGYNHSGWVSPNGLFYAFADETLFRKMKIVNIADFTDLNVISFFDSELNLKDNYIAQTAPHNLEWIGDKIYVSHYFDGLQVFDVEDPWNPKEFAYFDTYSEDDTPWRGAWGVHVMPSGRILISDRQSGFYMFKLIEENDDLSDFWVYPNPSDNEFSVNLSEYEFSSVSLEMTDSRGRKVFKKSFMNPQDDLRHIKLSIPDLKSGVYHLRALLDDNESELTKRIVIY